MTTSCIERALRHDDGAIMTEAVICLPFFIVLWMGLMALHSLWNARLSAQVHAHATAYSGSARGNCEGDTQPGATSTGEATGGLSNEASSAIEAGGNDLFDWSLHLVESRVTAAHIPEPFGGPTQTVTARARILCNTTPRSSLGDAIFDVISSWWE